MFRFGYGQYMQRAFPKDDLRPISCRGKNSQGGIALTLIDSLDTLIVRGCCECGVGAAAVAPLLPSRRQCPAMALHPAVAGQAQAAGLHMQAGCAMASQMAVAAVHAPHAVPALVQVMGERERLREAVRWLAANVTFDIDARVHVFELTIRAVGGMLSAHMLLEQVGAGAGMQGWLAGQAGRGMRADTGGGRLRRKGRQSRAADCCMLLWPHDPAHGVLWSPCHPAVRRCQPSSPTSPFLHLRLLGCWLPQDASLVPGYDGSLLRLSVDLTDRFLPAFETPTGIPLSWVNLRHVRA